MSCRNGPHVGAGVVVVVGCVGAGVVVVVVVVGAGVVVVVGCVVVGVGAGAGSVPPEPVDFVVGRVPPPVPFPEGFGEPAETVACAPVAADDVVYAAASDDVGVDKDEER
ncbi:MAG: hypothetical protein ACYCV7_14490 [Acidimicrobiales bacterium]